MPSEQTDRRDEAGVRLLSDITASVVRVYKEQFGRGPVGARSHFSGPDAIVCVLDQTLTPVERNLVLLGQHDRLRELRIFYQYATEEMFRAPVEELTGRRIRAFLSGIDVRTDVACEMFVFEPDGRGAGDGA